jgi:restriction system protein
MLPLLRLAGDGAEHKFRAAVEELASQFQLTDEERSVMLPSGSAPLFDNRVGWARTYLKQAGLLESTRRGVFKISDIGKTLLAKNPEKIDVALLDQFPAFREFRSRRRERTNRNVENNTLADAVVGDIFGAESPEDALASAYSSIRTSLETELLDQIKASSPSFFEQVVIDLLIKMGYGGSRQDAGRAIGRTGDEGIDGIINEDKLGLDTIYVQAKRWKDVVGRPEIQKFAGALQGKRAKKGIFITTSYFSREAEEYAALIETKIVLIDGERLALLMVDYNVGVSTVGQYELKKIDVDYFEGD